MNQKRNIKYNTIQIRDSVKRDIVYYCDQRGLKISKYVELVVLNAISGSLSGSLF